MDDLNPELESALAELERQGDDPASPGPDAELFAAHLVRLFPNVSKPRLVGQPDALSMLTRNAFAELVRKVGEVAVTCIWLRRTPTGAEDFPEVVEIVRRYRQPSPSTGPVVVFVPILRERSVARALLLAVANDEPAADLHLFCRAAAKSELHELKEEVAEIAGLSFEHHVGQMFENAPGTDVASTVAYRPLRVRVLDQVDRVPAIVVPAMRNALIDHLSSDESIEHQRRQRLERGHKFQW